MVERFVSRLKYLQNRFGSEKHESEISWRKIVRLDLIRHFTSAFFTKFLPNIIIIFLFSLFQQWVLFLYGMFHLSVDPCYVVLQIESALLKLNFICRLSLSEYEKKSSDQM